MKKEIQALAEIALKRQGGSNAIKGFVYQFLYSIFKILQEFVNDSQNCFKIEGVEDLDLYIKNDNANFFYQIKYSTNPFTTTDFKEKVLKNFLEVHLKNSESTFYLITNNNIASGELNDVKKWVQNDKTLADKTINFWEERCLEIKQLNSAWNWNNFNIRYFLSQIRFHTAPENSINSKISKLLNQFLVSFGITATNIELYENAIYNNVFLWAKNPQYIYRKDFVIIIDETRNAISKGTINKAVKGEWIKYVSFNNHYTKDIDLSYFDGQPAKPFHIKENLPIKRVKWEKIIIETINDSDVTVIQASSGQGKSTLAWQVIYELANNDYHPYELFECKRTDELGELTQFIYERIKIGEKPIVVLDGLNENLKEWKELVKRTSEFPVKYLITSREEDWFNYGTTYLPVKIKPVYISMDYEEAEKIYEAFGKKGKLFEGIVAWQSSWEKVKDKGLLIEFVYYITHGQMMRDRLEEQCKRIEKELEKTEILRLVSTATICNVKIKTDLLIKYINDNFNVESDINSIIRSLEKEYQISLKEHNYIEGLHPVRSKHLSEIVHQNIPLEISLKKIIDLIDSEDLFVFSSNAPLLFKYDEEKNSFLKYLANKCCTMPYASISNVINGIYSTDAKQHWKKNKEIYDDLFHGKGGLIYAADMIPWSEPIFKTLLEGNLRDENTANSAEIGLNNYSKIEKFVPVKSNTYEYLIALYKELFNYGLQDDLTGVGEIERWFSRFDLEPILISKTNESLLQLNFQVLNVENFGNLIWAVHKFNSNLFHEFYKERKDKIISLLKVKSNSISIEALNKHIEINYFFDISEESNLNKESVDRIGLISLYFPNYSDFRTKALYPPLSIFNYLLNGYDPSFKQITEEKYYDKFVQNTNKIWLKRITENYEFLSLYDWQKYIYNIRNESLYFVKDANHFIEKLLERKQEQAKKKAVIIDNQKEKVLHFFNKQKTIEYDSSFSELEFKKNIDKINSWMSSLNNVVVQLFPNDDNKLRVFNSNVLNVKNNLLEMQENYNYILNRTIRYFDTNELCNEEINWYNRFYDTMHYYAENKSNLSCVNAKSEIQRWKKIKNDDIFNKGIETIKHFEKNTGLRCIEPTTIISDGFLKNIVVGFMDITPIEFDKLIDVITIKLLDFVNTDIDYINIAFIDNKKLTQNSGISISKGFLKEIVNAIENGTVYTLGLSKPYPVEITEKMLATIPNVSFNTKNELSNEVGMKILILIWKLSEIRKRLYDKTNVEKKWKADMEIEFKAEIQRLIRSLEYKQFPFVNQIGYNEIIDEAVNRNEIIDDSKYEKLFQNLICEKVKPEAEKINSVFDMFTVDFKNIPDSSYEYTDEETDESGNKIKKFEKLLDYKEANLFNKIEIIQFENNVKNVIFSGCDITILSLLKIENFVNKLYSLYGKDGEGENEFNLDHKLNIVSEYAAYRKSWDIENSTFAIDVFDKTISFTIWNC